MVRRFFIEPADLNASTVMIRGSQARHMISVLRLRPGDDIRLFDGSGFEYLATIKRASAESVAVSIRHKYEPANESPLELIVAQALLKEKKMERLLRHICELGVAAWLPFSCERSVPKLSAARQEARLQRWQRIAVESAKQCRRAKLPEIEGVFSFEQILQRSRACDLSVIFWERETTPIDALLDGPTTSEVHKLMIVMGPEGGFAETEIQLANSEGFLTIGLGPRILRAETATIAACTLMQFLFGDLRQKNLDKGQGV